MKQILKLIATILMIAIFPAIEINAYSNINKELKELKKEYSQREKEYKQLIKYGVPDAVLQRKDEELSKLKATIEEFETKGSSDKKTSPKNDARNALLNAAAAYDTKAVKNTNEVMADNHNELSENKIDTKSKPEPKKTNPNEEIKLTVSSDGVTKDDALKNALRTAIEQAYGAFVSANTTILNDELVKDEIVTVSNGSIKEYKEISSFEKPDGSGYMMTVNATVSLPHLITYAKNHGSECEFAGSAMANNIKLQKLYQSNEQTAMQNLTKIICDLAPNSYNYTLEITKEPSQDDIFLGKKDLEFEGVIYFNGNQNLEIIFNTIKNTFESISRPVILKFSNLYDSTPLDPLTGKEIPYWYELNIPTVFACIFVESTSYNYKRGGCTPDFVHRDGRRTDVDYQYSDDNIYKPEELAVLYSRYLTRGKTYENEIGKIFKVMSQAINDWCIIGQNGTKISGDGYYRGYTGLGERTCVLVNSGKIDVKFSIPIDDIDKYSSFKVINKNSTHE